MADEIKLSSEVYDHLIAAERALSPAITHCEKAKRCKVPGIEGLDAAVGVMQERLQQFRQEFFPNGRPQ